MAQYSKRTCVNCGLRDIQPNMRQKETYVKSGNSKRGVSTSTIAGTFLGNKKSTNAVNSWLFNTQQRNYYRKRKIWTCKECYNKVKSEKPTEINWKFWFIVVITSPLWFPILGAIIEAS